MKITVGKGKMSIKCAGLFVLAFVFASKLGAMEDLSSYALPKGSSMRKKLEAISREPSSRSVRFTDGSKPGGSNAANDAFLEKVQKDPTWLRFDSWHWLVGGLTTDRKTTKFVVKGANHVAGEKIFKPNDPLIQPQIHTETQNLSRLKKAQEVKCVIAKNRFDKIRVPRMWVYPVSGNDDDLKSSNLRDQQVVIVEEMVDKKSEDVTSMGLNDVCQKDALEIDAEIYEQLVTVAEEAQVLDLHSKNFMVDKEGKVVLMDLEDILAGRQQDLEQSNVLLRPLKRFKLKCLRNGSTKIGVGLTGIVNTKDDAIKLRGIKLLWHGIFTSFVTRNIVEITGVTATTGLAIRRMYYVAKTNRQIRNCYEKVRRAIKLRQARDKGASDEIYIKIVRKIVTKAVPRENRQEIFEAFATMALAQIAAKTSSNAITILGVTYKDPEDALKKSRCVVNAIWRSDWSLPYKIARGVKKAVSGIRAVGNKLQVALSNTSKQSQQYAG